MPAERVAKLHCGGPSSHLIRTIGALAHPPRAKEGHEQVDAQCLQHDGAATADATSIKDTTTKDFRQGRDRGISSASRCWSISGRRGAARASSSPRSSRRPCSAAKGKVKLVKMNIDEHPADPRPDGHPVDPGRDRLRQRPAGRRLHGRAAGEPGDGLHRAADQGPHRRRGARICCKPPTPPRRRRCRRRGEIYAAAARRGQRQRAGACRPRPLLRRDRRARSGAGRRSRWCRRPSATTPRWPPRAPRSNSPNRPRRSARSPSCEQKVAADPLDHQARFDLALALNGKGQRRRRARPSDRDRQARPQMERRRRAQAARPVLRGLGPTDEATIAGRKRLSSILFA